MAPAAADFQHVAAVSKGGHRVDDCVQVLEKAAVKASCAPEKTLAEDRLCQRTYSHVAILACFIHERVRPGSQWAPNGSEGLVRQATSRFRRVDTTGKAVWPIDALVPTPKGPLTVRPLPRSRVVPVPPMASGRRADRARELAPRPEPGEARRQVQDDAAHRALHPHGELDQSLAQRGDLRVRARGAARATLELLEQQVRGQREQDAELVGQKARAAG